MEKYGLDSANFIKCLFIDFLLSIDKNIIIGNEVMYGTKRKVVDLINIQGEKISAIEIKSNSDNLNRIHEQVEEYKKIFNYVIIVTTTKFKDKILTCTTNDVGVYIVNDDLSISMVRRPTIQKKRNKLEMLYSINAKFLMKLEKIATKSYDSDSIRLFYAKRRISFIQEILILYWKLKYRDKFKLFLDERGEISNIEDLSILSSSFQIE